MVWRDGELICQEAMDADVLDVNDNANDTNIKISSNKS